MTFFSGATDVTILGGEFNIVNGDYTVYDHSHHTSNLNSFNTANNTVHGSFNDNSQQYYNQHGPQRQRPRNRLPSEAPDPRESSFPPPSVHPALGGTHALPPGSTVSSIDSFNIENTHLDSSNNNNSRKYEIPYSERKRTRNPDIGPQGLFRKDSGSRPTTNMGSSARVAGYPVQSHGYIPAGPTYKVSGSFNGMNSVSSANFLPGQVTGMSDSTRAAMDMLMRQVANQKMQNAGQTVNGGREESGGSDDSEDTSDDEPVNAQHKPGIAQSTFSDDSPLLSSLSQPQRTSQKTKQDTPRNNFGSTDEQPENGNIEGQINDGSQSLPAQFSGPNTALAAFGSAISSTTQGAVFNTIHGSYTKYDYAHRISNIGSGNTHNMLINDSFNDASLQTFEPPEKRKSGARFRFKKLGRKLRGD